MSPEGTTPWESSRACAAAMPGLAGSMPKTLAAADRGSGGVAWPAPPAVCSMPSMQRILAAVDFSEITDAVIRAAAAQARAFAGGLWLIHVAAPDPDFVGFDAGPQTVRDSRAAKVRQEHRTMQAAA